MVRRWRGFVQSKSQMGISSAGLTDPGLALVWCVYAWLITFRNAHSHSGLVPFFYLLCYLAQEIFACRQGWSIGLGMVYSWRVSIRSAADIWHHNQNIKNVTTLEIFRHLNLLFCQVQWTTTRNRATSSLKKKNPHFQALPRENGNTACWPWLP